ncbi:MAG: nucleotidyl transferase AbiEii/AbiGii toxin family protein [Ferrimicrobium sp.]
MSGFQGDPRGVLPSSVCDAWEAIVPFLPNGSYLAGGTAVVLRLRHRQSNDLDFFTSEPLDVEGLLDALTESSLSFVTRRVAPKGGSLAIILGSTLIEFTNASMVVMLEPTEKISDIEVANLGDLLAMKLTTITKRKALRDYDDIRAIEQIGGRRVEEGLALAARRYRISDDAGLLAIVRALAEVDQCGPDPLVSASSSDLTSYWSRRLPEIAASLSRWAVAELPGEIAAALLRDSVLGDADDIRPHEDETPSTGIGIRKSRRC